MTDSGVIDKSILAFGQMNEPSGSRMRVALSGLTMAEYLRDEKKQDVLLFIDNIYRFVQAGNEVSSSSRTHALRRSAISRHWQTSSASLKSV